MFFDFQFNFKSLPAANGDGILSSYVMGLLTSLAWAPCYSGYLISLITLLISSNSPGYAVLNIGIYCVGFAVTLLIISYAISKIDLEKLILKTKYIPKIFAILVIIGALYLMFESVKVII